MLTRVVLLLSMVTAGLSAGLFFAFAYAVMPGLARAGDRTLVTAMQGVNVAILNPLFLVVYLGPLVFGAATAVALLGDGQGDVLGWTIAGVAALPGRRDRGDCGVQHPVEQRARRRG